MSDLRIDYVPLSRIVRLPRNAKSHDLGSIIASFEEFGMIDPIGLNDETGHDFDGNGRLDALQSMKAQGMKPPVGVRLNGSDWLIPVVRGVALSALDEERAALALNRLNELGGFDDSMLASILSDLAAQDKLEGTGYDGDDLDALLRELGEQKESVEDKGAQVDCAAELQEKWQVKRGNLYSIGTHRLLCGDSTKREDVERLTDGEQAALCVTSPPYFVGKDYERQTIEDEIITFIHEVSANIIIATKPERRIVINCATTPWSHVNGGKVDYRLNLDWWQKSFRDLGWFTRSIRIWSKHGGLVHNTPNADIVDMHWEYLATFYNPSAKYRGQNRVGEGWSTSGIWEGIHGEKQDSHSAPYPVVIPQRFIQLYTDEGEMVFEPFGGSGTTIVAAEQTGRICYAMELEEKYCAVICERMTNLGLTPQLL